MMLMLSASTRGCILGVCVVLGRGGALRLSRGDTTYLFPHCTSSLAAMVCDEPVGIHAYGVVWHSGLIRWCL